MKIQYHCECPNCKGSLVTEREARWSDQVPIVMIPFSISDGSWRCPGCDKVWSLQVELLDVTKHYDNSDEVMGMPKVEGVCALGKIQDCGGGINFEAD